MRHLASKSLPILFLLLASCAVSQTQSAVHYDGHWWNGRDMSYKLGFVLGFIQGVGLVADETQIDCVIAKYQQKRPPKAPPPTGVSEACTNPRWDFDKIRSGELQEGLDVFYADFRNKAVFVNDAVLYVRDELKGKSAAELEKELENFRASARR